MSKLNTLKFLLKESKKLQETNLIDKPLTIQIYIILIYQQIYN